MLLTKKITKQLLTILFVLSLTFSGIFVVSQESNTDEQIYRSNLTKSNTANGIQYEWVESWETRRSNGSPMREVVMVQGSANLAEISSSCHNALQSDFSAFPQYLLNGEPVQNFDPSTVFDLLNSSVSSFDDLVSNVACASSEISERNGIISDTCSTPVDPQVITEFGFPDTSETNLQVWVNTESQALVGYLLDSYPHFMSRYDSGLIDQQSLRTIDNDAISLRCTNDPFFLPDDAQVTLYAPDNLLRFDTAYTTDELKNQYREYLGNEWAILYDSPRLQALSSSVSACSIDLQYQNVSDTNVSVLVQVTENYASQQNVINLLEGQGVVAAGIPGAPEPSIVEGTVPFVSENLLQIFEAENWQRYERLISIDNQSAFLTVKRDNYALYMFVQNIGGNQVQIHYQTDIATCGTTFNAP